MDMAQMAGAEAAPQPSSPDLPPSREPSQPNSDAIAAACVQATEVAMGRLQSAMAAQGHTPPGV